MQLSLSLDTEPREETGTIFERVKNCKSLPILSPLASKILKMCQDENIEVSTLANMISQDPGMAAQILYMANSAYYGGARHKVTSILQGVNLLGFSLVSNLALSFCFGRLMKDIQNTPETTMDHDQFWRRSIFASMAARAIGQHIAHPDAELMFLAALLQDIGILALYEVATEEMLALHALTPNDHVELFGQELEHLGIDHAQVGAWLAQQWELPEEFQVSILYSHTPELFETPADLQILVDVVALSSVVADIWITADTEKAIEQVQEKSQGRLLIQPEEWESILDHIMAGIPQIASFFQTRLGSFEEITHVHRLALKHLAPSNQTQTT